MRDKIVKLFELWSNETVSSILLLPSSGSNRKYYRVEGVNKRCIAAYNDNLKENIAFFRFSEAMKDAGLSVPAIFAIDSDNLVYLLEDLGDVTLFDVLNKDYHTGQDTDRVRRLYHKVIDGLIGFQLNKNIDYSYCYPRAKFDRSSMMWDLNYFKYYFLKLAGIKIDEQALENDFETLVSYLESIPSNYFMFRDFQSRNIMVGDDDKLTFIDYQGGRMGALHYDVASLLYDGKAGLSQNFREEILEYYISEISKRIENIDRIKFKKDFYLFVIIRIMQALGTYGYRGFFERKSHFLLSIPYAQKNLDWIINNVDIDLNIPTIKSYLKEIVENERLSRYGSNDGNKLRVKVSSFSYKNGYPEDYSGNGGGFVFDCRGLENPGRYKEYKNLTGKDTEVINFLIANSSIDNFVQNCYSLTRETIDNFLSRGFNSLCISFGCTGGQHRSVYSAELFTRMLKNDYTNIIVELNHRELNSKLS